MTVISVLCGGQGSITGTTSNTKPEQRSTWSFNQQRNELEENYAKTTNPHKLHLSMLKSYNKVKETLPSREPVAGYSSSSFSVALSLTIFSLLLLSLFLFYFFNSFSKENYISLNSSF